jgi:hypothetical protein
MKILFLLHALLKDIQECLSSYQSQEFFAVNGLHLCEATIEMPLGIARSPRS